MVAALVVLGALAAMWGRDASTGDGSGSTVARPDDTTPAAGTWAVPKAFLGEWKGTAGNGDESYSIDLVVRSGKNGEEVATTVLGDERSGARCERIERLVVAEESELSFAARNITGPGCGADGRTSTIVLAADGGLTYRSQAGGMISGTLRKA